MFSHCVDIEGEAAEQFVKLYLGAPWLQKSLGIDRKISRSMGHNTIIHRLKKAIKQVRGKRSVLCRKMLADGTLSEKVDVVVDGFKVTMLNSVMTLMMLAEESQLKWFVTQLWSDVKRAQHSTSTSPRVDEGTDIPADVVLESDDDDPESAALLQEINDIKKSKERFVARY